MRNNVFNVFKKYIYIYIYTYICIYISIRDNPDVHFVAYSENWWRSKRITCLTWFDFTHSMAMPRHRFKDLSPSYLSTGTQFHENSITPRCYGAAWQPSVALLHRDQLRSVRLALTRNRNEAKRFGAMSFSGKSDLHSRELAFPWLRARTTDARLRHATLRPRAANSRSELADHQCSSPHETNPHETRHRRDAHIALALPQRIALKCRACVPGCSAAGLSWRRGTRGPALISNKIRARFTMPADRERGSRTNDRRERHFGIRGSTPTSPISRVSTVAVTHRSSRRCHFSRIHVCEFCWPMVTVVDGEKSQVSAWREPRHKREGEAERTEESWGSELSTSSFRARHRIEPGLRKKKKDRAGIHRAWIAVSILVTSTW